MIRKESKESSWLSEPKKSFLESWWILETDEIVEVNLRDDDAYSLWLKLGKRWNWSPKYSICHHSFLSPTPVSDIASNVFLPCKKYAKILKNFKKLLCLYFKITKCKNSSRPETKSDSNIPCFWMNCMFEMFLFENSILQS